MHSSFVSNWEIRAKLSKISQEVHLRQLEKLKTHPETHNATEEYKDVLDFISTKEGPLEIKDAIIYETTVNAIDSLKKFAEEEIKKELSKNQEEIDPKLINVLIHSLYSRISPAAFFSTISKEIYVIKNFVDKHYYRDSNKKKPGQKSISKYYIPKRFNESEWFSIQNKASVAHELLHLIMDSRASVQNEGLHEEYAYGNMTAYCKHVGLEEEEIINGFLISYGYIISRSKKPDLANKFRKKEWKEEALKEAKKLYDQFINQESSTVNKIDTNFEQDRQRRRIKFLEL